MSDCPNCGRIKAQGAIEAARGYCPKWWAVRDEAAEQDCKNFHPTVRSVLQELLRLMDWRTSLGTIERDPYHDKKQMKSWLNQYGHEKKNAWQFARIVLSPTLSDPNVFGILSRYSNLAALLRGRISDQTALAASTLRTELEDMLYEIQNNPYKVAWEQWRSMQTGDVQQMMDCSLRYLYLRTHHLGTLLSVMETTDMSDVGLDSAIDRKLKGR